MGDQRCEIVGVGLYDESMNQISSSYNDEIVVLRLTIKNKSLPGGSLLSTGYIFKNSKGLDIASSNSLLDGLSLVLTDQSEFVTVSMKITLPCLYPGSYSFSVSVSKVEKSGETVLLDRIENAVIFEVLSKKKVHVMMSFPTKFEVEL